MQLALSLQYMGQVLDGYKHLAVFIRSIRSHKSWESHWKKYSGRQMGVQKDLGKDEST